MFDMSYSGLSSMKSLDRVDQADLIMPNEIGTLVFAEHLNRDICLEQASDDCTITSLARLDAWIYVKVFFMCDEHNMELDDRKRGIQKKYQDSPRSCCAASSLKHTQCIVSNEV